MNKYGLYILLGGIFLIEIFFVILFMIPQVFKFYENWTALQEDSKVVSSLVLATQTISEQKPEDIKPYFNRAQAALPNEKKAAGFLTGLTNFAAKYGVAVSAFDFSPGLISTSSAATAYILTNEAGEITAAEGVKAVPANLTVSGKITSIKSFLDALKNTSQILSVTTIDYSLDSARLSLLIFYQPLSDNKTIWNQLEPLSAEEINFLGTFNERDVFKLP